MKLENVVGILTEDGMFSRIKNKLFNRKRNRAQPAESSDQRPQTHTVKRSNPNADLDDRRRELHKSADKVRKDNVRQAKLNSLYKVIEQRQRQLSALYTKRMEAKRSGDNEAYIDIVDEMDALFTKQLADIRSHPTTNEIAKREFGNDVKIQDLPKILSIYKKEESYKQHDRDLHSQKLMRDERILDREVKDRNSSQ